MKYMLLVLFISPIFLPAQSKKQRKAIEAQQKADQAIINNLKSHFQYLSTAANSKEKAAEYISNQFKSTGLQPKGTSSYYQPFKVQDGKQIAPGTLLKINNKLLEPGKDYVPLAYSAEKSVSGMPAMALREKGVPWFLDIKDWLEDNGKTGDLNFDEAVQKEAVKFAAKGATALFVYNSGNTIDKLAFNKNDNSTSSTIPVIYISPQGYKKFLSDNSELLDIELNVAFKESVFDVTNVVGYIDNKAPSTIIITSPFEKINLNEDNSLAIDSTAQGNSGNSVIGASMLIELAKILLSSKAKTNNYLFIATGGTKGGEPGIKYFIDNPTINTASNYLVNIDGTGSQNGDDNVYVAGTTSSPSFSEIMASVTARNPGLKINTIDTSNALASFIKKGIPYLFFTTANYNSRVSNVDIADNISYEGELKIIRFISDFIETSNTKGKLAFAATN